MPNGPDLLHDAIIIRTFNSLSGQECYIVRWAKNAAISCAMPRMLYLSVCILSLELTVALVFSDS